MWGTIHKGLGEDNRGTKGIQLLLQGIVGRHYLLSFRKGWSSAPYAKGDMKGSIEAPFLSIMRIQPALIMTATYKLCSPSLGSIHMATFDL